MIGILGTSVTATLCILMSICLFIYLIIYLSTCVQVTGDHIITVLGPRTRSDQNIYAIKVYDR